MTESKVGDMGYEKGIWYGWTGGKCPVHPETKVDYLTARGVTVRGCPAKNVNWSKGCLPCFVSVAFKVVEHYKEPEVKEMTVEEISKVLGYEVKVVK